MGCAGSKEDVVKEDGTQAEGSGRVGEEKQQRLHLQQQQQQQQQQKQQQQQPQASPPRPVAAATKEANDSLFVDRIDVMTAHLNQSANLNQSASDRGSGRSGRSGNFGRPSLTESPAPYVDLGSGQLHTSFSRQLCGFPTCSFTSDSGAMVLCPMEENVPFRLKKLIGEGGCGKVYLAEWMGKNVAVKVISGYSAILPAGMSGEGVAEAEDQQLMEQDERKERMTQLEAVLMAVVDHPNLVTTYKVMAANNVIDQASDETQPSVYHYCIIMEHAAQGSLWAALLTNRFHRMINLEEHEHLPNNVDLEAVQQIVKLMHTVQPPPPAQPFELIVWDAWSCLELIKEVALAVKYLHDNNVLHGDLKVANVLLSNGDKDRRGFVCKITDFGFSRILKPDGHLKTETHGTVTHMPPELLKEGSLTAATDVYSIGIIMWEVFCAQGVYKDMSDSQVIYKVVNEGLRPQFPPGCPASFSFLAGECWMQDPGKRPQIEYILEELESMQRQLCPLGPMSEYLPILGTPHVPRRRRKPSNADISRAQVTKSQSTKMMSGYGSLSLKQGSSNGIRYESTNSAMLTDRGGRYGSSSSIPEGKQSSDSDMQHQLSNSHMASSAASTASNSSPSHGRTQAAAMGGKHLDAAQVIAMSISKRAGQPSYYGAAGASPQVSPYQQYAPSPSDLSQLADSFSCGPGSGNASSRPVSGTFTSRPGSGTVSQMHNPGPSPQNNRGSNSALYALPEVHAHRIEEEDEGSPSQTMEGLQLDPSSRLAYNQRSSSYGSSVQQQLNNGGGLQFQASNLGKGPSAARQSQSSNGAKAAQQSQSSNGAKV